MRILADENVAGSVTAALRLQGHDVEWVAEIAAGTHDNEVFLRAVREQRILLTHDKEFAAMAAARSPAGLAGVILLRLEGMSPARIAAFVTATVGSRQDWPGHFSVIEPARLRMKKLRNSNRNRT